MNTANRITKSVIATLLVICSAEGLILWQKDRDDSRALESSQAITALCNAAILLGIRDDIVHQQTDIALSKIDRNIDSAIAQYHMSKERLKFELPGEAECLKIIKERDPAKLK